MNKFILDTENFSKNKLDSVQFEKKNKNLPINNEITLKDDINKYENLKNENAILNQNNKEHLNSLLNESDGLLKTTEFNNLNDNRKILSDEVNDEEFNV